MQYDQLKTRIAELEAEIADSDAETRDALVSQLERVVRTLEMEGVVTPCHASVARDHQEDDAVEAQFDNLPV